LKVIFVDPNEIFKGVILIVAPHMDDEVLACGGTIAQLPDKKRIHVIYATDGSKSPVPMFPWLGSISPDLTLIRMGEARTALGMLGIPEGNIHFLGFSDGRLGYYLNELSQSLAEFIKRLKPVHVLIPFRYDRHPDHLTLNCATTKALKSANYQAKVAEYFIYYRWRLLSGGDIRKFIWPDHLLKIDIRAQAAQKKKALNCFKSQTTLFFDWQDRPILPKQRLDEVSQSPECFLRYDPAFPDATIFASSRTWIRLIHRVEPSLKKSKDQVSTLLRMGIARNGRKPK
jgi:LmbE family N-acetylglucosaminyl deacetylase